MIVESLSLLNFRNYETADFHFSEKVNILYGNNGEGKTNLLESIYLLSRGFSHRVQKLTDLIRFGSDGLYLSSTFFSKNTHHRLKLVLNSQKKKWELDGKALKSHSPAAEVTSCIFFEPNDLEIVKGGPDRRRRFMNEEIAGLSPSYLDALRRFEKIRYQRNALLKKIKAGEVSIQQADSLLPIWNEQLADAARPVMLSRSNYLIQLNRQAKKIHKELSGTNEELGLQYHSNFITSLEDLSRVKDVYLEKLNEHSRTDIDRGYTILGPHADDLDIKINGKPARQFASQGQQRSAVISLKLAHLQLYKEKTGEFPVVLLDDILSELDLKRQENLLRILEGTQSFITCTDHSIAENMIDRMELSRDLVNFVHISGGHQIDE